MTDYLNNYTFSAFGRIGRRVVPVGSKALSQFAISLINRQPLNTGVANYEV